MKAIELAAFGLHGLDLVDRPQPVVAPNEVLVRIRAASLNYRDVEILEGRYAMPVPLPIVPLSDAVGVIVALGSKVEAFRVGDTVCPMFFPEWVDGPFSERFFANQLGGNVDGVLREFVAMPASSVAKAPTHLADEAATLPIAALTAWSAMVDAGVGPGQRMVVIGTGGVSLFALQFAPLFGVEAILVSSNEASIARAQEIGATAAVNRELHPNWGTLVREMTDGNGVDLVVDVAGASTMLELPMALRTGGTVAMVGYASGPRLTIDMRSLFIARRARLHGHTVGSRRQFEAMCRAMEDHRIVPVIDSRFNLQETQSAYDRQASGRSFGKVLITF